MGLTAANVGAVLGLSAWGRAVNLLELKETRRESHVQFLLGLVKDFSKCAVFQLCSLSY